MASRTLVDASVIAVHHPHTFYEPGTETIDRVAAGGSVKPAFVFDTDNPDMPCAERFRVTVKGIEADDVFSGCLDNYPQYIRDLPLGEHIVFEARHVINTEHDPRETLILRYARRCFMTRRVADEGKAVGYLYREASEEKDDSDWRLTAGDEPDDYMNITGTTAYVGLGSVLSADDSILPLPGVPPGRTFERLTNGSSIEVQGLEG